MTRWRLNLAPLPSPFDAIDAAFRSRGIKWLIVTPSQKVPQPMDLAARQRAHDLVPLIHHIEDLVAHRAAK